MPWSDQTGRIMKKPEEYSKNPNTIRARARKARLDPFTREVEQAKASDSKAVTRAWKIQIQSKEYKQADADVRKILLEKTEHNVMQRRRSRGYDADSKIARFLSRSGAITSSTPTLDRNSAFMTYGLTHMQPLAQMQPTTPTGQGGNCITTPGPYQAQVMPSNEDQRAMTEASISQHHLPGTPRGVDSPLGPDLHSISDLSRQINSVSNDVTIPQHFNEAKQYEPEVTEKEKEIRGLAEDLILARSAIRSQESRIQQLEQCLELYHKTATWFSRATVDCSQDNSTISQFTLNFQKTPPVPAAVCNGLVGENHDAIKDENDNIIRPIPRNFRDIIQDISSVHRENDSTVDDKKNSTKDADVPEAGSSEDSNDGNIHGQIDSFVN